MEDFGSPNMLLVVFEIGTSQSIVSSNPCACRIMCIRMQELNPGVVQSFGCKVVGWYWYFLDLISWTLPNCGQQIQSVFCNISKQG